MAKDHITPASRLGCFSSDRAVNMNRPVNQQRDSRDYRVWSALFVPGKDPFITGPNRVGTICRQEGLNTEATELLLANTVDSVYPKLIRAIETGTFNSHCKELLARFILTQIARRPVYMATMDVEAKERWGTNELLRTRMVDLWSSQPRSYRRTKFAKDLLRKIKQDEFPVEVTRIFADAVNAFSSQIVAACVFHPGDDFTNVNWEWTLIDAPAGSFFITSADGVLMEGANCWFPLSSKLALKISPWADSVPLEVRKAMPLQRTLITPENAETFNCMLIRTPDTMTFVCEDRDTLQRMVDYRILWDTKQEALSQQTNVVVTPSL